ncbi:MAG: hypothetical protein JOZ60_08720 [Verrucomicrobia bacterium]|nr:hypothetical protein [Verrucomicrobiota bacterium]
MSITLIFGCSLIGQKIILVAKCEITGCLITIGNGTKPRINPRGSIMA